MYTTDIMCTDMDRCMINPVCITSNVMLHVSMLIMYTYTYYVHDMYVYIITKVNMYVSKQVKWK